MAAATTAPTKQLNPWHTSLSGKASLDSPLAVVDTTVTVASASGTGF